MKLFQLLPVREQDDDLEDDYDSSVYEREKKVGLQILKVFRKCGLSVADHRHKHSGVQDHDDYWGKDVLYTDEEHEASVTLEEADLSDLVKLKDSGLIDGKCEISSTSDGTLRLTFKVHPAIASGNADLS